MTDRGDRVAVVTGAARGIGAAIATRLAGDGAHVAVLDVADCGATVEAVREQGREAWALQVDLSDRAAVREVLGGFAEEHAVDILVNNAGLLSTSPIAAVSDEEWDRVLAVNLTAALVTTQVVWPGMAERGDGRLVYIGSRAARTGGNNAGPAYVASKGGIHALVISAAREGAAFGIRANGVMPGPIRTEMTRLPSYDDESAATPLGRMGRPEDIAAAVSYLASDDAAFVTGTVLNVSGGLLMG